LRLRQTVNNSVAMAVACYLLRPDLAKI